MSKFHGTSAAIAAEAGQVSVSVVIDHLEVSFAVVAEENESVSTDAKPSMAQMGDQFMGFDVKFLHSIINHDEIIACALVFVE